VLVLAISGSRPMKRQDHYEEYFGTFKGASLTKGGPGEFNIMRRCEGIKAMKMINFQGPTVHQKSDFCFGFFPIISPVGLTLAEPTGIPPSAAPARACSSAARNPASVADMVLYDSGTLTVFRSES